MKEAGGQVVSHRAGDVVGTRWVRPTSTVVGAGAYAFGMDKSADLNRGTGSDAGLSAELQAAPERIVELA